MSETKDKPTPLGPHSTLKELFEELEAPPGMIRTVPITLANTPNGHAQFMIAITGEFETAQVIIAQVMTLLRDLNDGATQVNAENENKIEAANGEKLSDEPTIIVP